MTKMLLKLCFWVFMLLVINGASVLGDNDLPTGNSKPLRILLDTDVDTDDFFALLYLLKLNRSDFKLEGITISTNAWSDAGHAVNQIYDILYMMGRDDISVGVGGEGGILDNGTILPDVGGYLPIIDQGLTTAGYCRYRQAIPTGRGGRLDVDTNFGFRKEFLPQGFRKYSPLRQETTQKVLIDKISAGPVSIIATGVFTNLAVFLMSNPHLKRNIKHIYVMGGSLRCMNTTGSQCGDPGNIFTASGSNPYAEFNMFGDPFAAYQVFHSGIAITLVPLDATNTIPITKDFFDAFEQRQHTLEAQYVFKTLKMTRDTKSEDQFYTNYFMWDTFALGVAVSIMQNSNNQDGENEFAEMEYMNVTVVTSNEPYGTADGSNPLFQGYKVPKFGLKKGGVHDGHVQKGLRDPFCLSKYGKGRCKDGYTMKVSGPESVRVLVATKAKPGRDPSSKLDRAFYQNFLHVLNHPQQTGRFNFRTQFAHYRDVFHIPNFEKKKLGKPVVFDMDMSVGDFLALLYLLKVPVELINLKAIVVSRTGWANAATIDVVYDLLHMMGRDDIPVGLGAMFAMNQSDPIFSAVGDCKYSKAIPQGSGGFLDSDTLYGLARNMPRSPRRYTAENSVKYGAPRDTERPQLRQPSALEVWESAVETLDPGYKITVLTNGPLTNLASIVSSQPNITSLIQEVYIVGGHISQSDKDTGNVFSIPSNKYAEFNMFLDPLAAKTVLESALNITLIPLTMQLKVVSFPRILKALHQAEQSPEAQLVLQLISRLYRLKKIHHRYRHMETFLGEIIGSVMMGSDNSSLDATYRFKSIKVVASGVENEDGQILVDEKQGKQVKVLENLDPGAYYNEFASKLGDSKQTSVIGSFYEQRRSLNTPRIQ